MDDSGDAAEASTPSTSSTPDDQPVLNANGLPLDYNPKLERRSWPKFLRNLSARIVFFCLAAACVPVSIGVVWFTNIPRWQVLIMGGSNGVGLLGVGIFATYARKGEWTKHDLNVQVAMSVDGLLSNYTLQNPYLYQKP